MESILTSIKKMLGIADDYTHFDTDIIIHINTALNILTQLGVGPSEGFSIFDKELRWDDFVPSDSKLDLIKTYVYLKVRMLFDPPLSSAVAEAMKENIKELEFRISVTVDPGEEEE